jgi:hypothetical protein
MASGKKGAARWHEDEMCKLFMQLTNHVTRQSPWGHSNEWFNLPKMVSRGERERESELYSVET